jgi:hypothetical protein
VLFAVQLVPFCRRDLSTVTQRASVSAVLHASFAPLHK